MLRLEPALCHSSWHQLAWHHVHMTIQCAGNMSVDSAVVDVPVCGAGRRLTFQTRSLSAAVQ